jgi:hypothetical protein
MSIETETLRITPTNSASDSEGAVWGISGNLLWLVLVGAFAGCLTWALLWRLTSCAAATAGVLSLLPVALTLAYALFKQAHPPGYDLDLLESWIASKGFGPDPSGPNDPWSDLAPSTSPYHSPPRPFHPCTLDHPTDTSTIQ